MKQARLASSLGGLTHTTDRPEESNQSAVSGLVSQGGI